MNDPQAHVIKLMGYEVRAPRFLNRAVQAVANNSPYHQAIDDLLPNKEAITPTITGTLSGEENHRYIVTEDGAIAIGALYHKDIKNTNRFLGAFLGSSLAYQPGNVNAEHINIDSHSLPKVLDTLLKPLPIGRSEEKLTALKSQETKELQTRFPMAYSLLGLKAYSGGKDAYGLFCITNNKENVSYRANALEFYLKHDLPNNLKEPEQSYSTEL